MGPAPKAEPMKQRVNRCLLRLSDRDTEAMAAAELDGIARGLEADELPRSSPRCPTRAPPTGRRCGDSLRLLALLAAAHPRDDPGAARPQARGAALRASGTRTRPCAPRSSTPRGAAAAAAAADAALARSSGRCSTSRTSARSSPPRSRRPRPSRRPPQARTSPPTSRPSSAPPQASPQLRVQGQAGAHLPHRRRLGRLRRRRRGHRGALLRDALTGEDWAARKAAAEALALLALEHGDNLVEQKPSCIAVFEAKRFDKVEFL